MRSDPLRVIEAAYDDVANERVWLQAITDAAQPLLDDGLGLYANVYTLPRNGRPPKRSPFATAGEMIDAERRQRAIDRGAPREIIASAFSQCQVGTISEYHAYAGDEPAAAVRDQLVPYGASDCIGLVTVDPNGRGIAISVMLKKPRIVTPSFRERWSRIMAHVGAGLRLRGGFADEEAVLDGSGKLLDATSFAKEPEARAALRFAARAIDRARARRRSDPDDALAQWRALTSGRWSLVDRFESDGRHFLVARANPPLPRETVPKLTPREACAVALAARGRSNKMIAYELGLSIGTIGTLLSRAAKKLNVRSRAMLVIEWNSRSA